MIGLYYQYQRLCCENQTAVGSVHWLVLRLVSQADLTDTLYSREERRRRAGGGGRGGEEEEEGEEEERRGRREGGEEEER